MASCGSVRPENLPPTERAACFHGLRAHYQIMEWSLQEESRMLQAVDWGWKEHRNMLLPIPTDLDLAPELLKKVVRCKCKNSGRNICGTNRCSCRSHGLHCLRSCVGCRGENCTNREVSVKNLYFIPGQIVIFILFACFFRSYVQCQRTILKSLLTKSRVD